MPVVHELSYSLARLPEGRRKQQLDDYFERLLQSPLLVLPYDCRAALRHGEAQAQLTAAGRTLPFVDGQIAAIALVNKLILVTVNTDDFASFPGLRLENWFEPGDCG